MRDLLFHFSSQDGGANECLSVRMPLGRCHAERLLDQAGN